MFGSADIVILAFCTVLTIIVVVGVALPYWRRYEPMSGRALKRDARGDLTAIGGHEPDDPLQFEGRGTWSSQPIPLAAGSYRIAFRFPADVTVRLGLLSSSDGEECTLLIKSGSGVAGFELESASYIVQVQPADEGVAWQIEIQRMKQLPRQP